MAKGFLPNSIFFLAAIRIMKQPYHPYLTLSGEIEVSPGSRIGQGQFWIVGFNVWQCIWFYEVCQHGIFKLYWNVVCSIFKRWSFYAANVTFYTTGFLLNSPKNISLLSSQAKDSIERSGNLYILYHFAIYLNLYWCFIDFSLSLILWTEIKYGHICNFDY